jgi:hypothetical protein
MNRILCVLLALTLLSGCSQFQPPPGYVKLREPYPYEQKAVSPRGNAIALSVRDNEDDEADLSFWSSAVEYQKVDLDGMKLAARENIRSEAGLDGVLFHFESGEGQGRQAYLVALYVTPRRIYTIEATGPGEAISEDTDKLRQSMLSLR